MSGSGYFRTPADRSDRDAVLNSRALGGLDAMSAVKYWRVRWTSPRALRATQLTHRESGTPRFAIWLATCWQAGGQGDPAHAVLPTSVAWETGGRDGQHTSKHVMAFAVRSYVERAR